MQYYKIVDNVVKNEESKKRKNELRSLYRARLQFKKKLFNGKFIDSATNKSKAMWQIVNQHRGKLAQVSTDNNTSCNISCDSFNSYFANICSNTAVNKASSELPQGSRSFSIDNDDQATTISNTFNL